MLRRHHAQKFGDKLKKKGMNCWKPKDYSKAISSQASSTLEEGSQTT